MQKLILIFAFMPTLWLFGNDSDMKKVKLSEVFPTQFCVGFKEVEAWKEKIKQKKNPAEWEEFLKDKRGKVVRAKDGLYLVDGHHFARALNDSGLEIIYVKIDKDYSDLSDTDFWAKMKKKQLVYPFDCDGEPAKVEDLPTHIAKLKDDPYRSLAWMVREAGGYENLKEPFQEFAWANFFRAKKIKINGDTAASWDDAVKEGKALARSEEAAELPGYLGAKKD